MNGPSSSLVDRLEATYSGAVFDVLREMGLPNQAMPSTIRPLDPRMKSAGPVYTASGRVVGIPKICASIAWRNSSTPKAWYARRFSPGWMQKEAYLKYGRF